MMMTHTYQHRSLQQQYSRRRVVRRMAWGVGAAASALLLGCSSSRKPQSGPGGVTPKSQEPLQFGGTATIVAEANVSTLDPHQTSANSTMYVLGAVMSRLLRYQTGADPMVVNDHKLENDLAISMESPDASTWTFKLRPDARFHDVAPVNGRPVEAEDVKASFVRALSVTQNPNRGSIGMIDPAQIQTPSPDTVVFKLKYPFAPFASLMASPAYAWILPREALAGSYDPAKQAIGSGPFLFDSYTQDVAFTLKKNPSWFETGRPYLDGIRYVIVPDPAQRVAQFVSGNLDEVTLDNSSTVETVKKSAASARIIVGRSASGGGYPLYFQLGDPASPFQDIRLRQAISLALDRKAIGKVIFNDQYDIVFMVGAGFGRWSLRKEELAPATAKYLEHDPAEAKKLAAAAGATNLSIKLEYITGFAPFGAAYRTQQEMENNMLNSAGIKSTLVALDFLKDVVANGRGTRYGNFGSDVLYSPGVVAFSDVDQVFFNYWDSRNPISQTRLHDSSLDAMIDKERSLVNTDERVKACIEIEKYIADRMYAVSGMPQGYAYTAIQPRLQNYNYSNTVGLFTETYSRVWLKR